jgi:hypothetical protein
MGFKTQTVRYKSYNKNSQCINPNLVFCLQKTYRYLNLVSSLELGTLVYIC